MRPDHRETARAFDAVAPHYDAVYGPGGNTAMRWMRQESLALLKAPFPPGSRLLEIGCGTGEEAWALAGAQRSIIATDISSRMAAQTATRARIAGLSERITALCVPAGGLATLRHRLPFDGAYASFGALNCKLQLERLALALQRLVRPGAAFVCSVTARWCPFEIASFLLHAQPTVALRRFHREW
jgi:ubiquinone/menaquinone biosynthesis C-methylase UbiE